jgi:hypothetical protein
MRARITLGVLAAVSSCALLTACWGGDSATSGGESPRASERPRTVPAGTFVRTCVPIVYGGLPKHVNLRSSVIGGPVVFYSVRQYRDYPRMFRKQADGRYFPIKQLLLVRPNTRAAVIVPESERQEVALLYDLSAVESGAHLASTEPGTPAVIFSACDAHGTSDWVQFNGSMIVLGPRCVHLDVYNVRENGALIGEATRIALPYGKSCR